MRAAHYTPNPLLLSPRSKDKGATPGEVGSAPDVPLSDRISGTQLTGQRGEDAPFRAWSGWAMPVPPGTHRTTPRIFGPPGWGRPPLSFDHTIEKSTTMLGKAQEHLRWAKSLWDNGQYRDTAFRGSVCTRHSLPCRSPSRGHSARGHRQRRRYCVAAGGRRSRGGQRKRPFALPIRGRRQCWSAKSD